MELTWALLSRDVRSYPSCTRASPQRRPATRKRRCPRRHGVLSQPHPTGFAAQVRHFHHLVPSRVCARRLRRPGAQPRRCGRCVGTGGRLTLLDAWNQRREHRRHIEARARRGAWTKLAHRRPCRLPPERYYPGFKAIYESMGWSLDHIDRVYDSSLAVQKLGWKPRVNFGTILSGLKSGASQVEWNPPDRRVNSTYTKP
jgi:hypothetical protein